MLLMSCARVDEKGYFDKEVIRTDFNVTKVSVYKYSSVDGFIVYDNKRIYLDNGNTGYYYKDYNLEPGQTISTIVTIYYHSTHDGYKLVFSDIDVSKYEK